MDPYQTLIRHLCLEAREPYKHVNEEDVTIKSCFDSPEGRRSRRAPGGHVRSQARNKILKMGNHSNIIRHVDVPNSAGASQWVLTKRCGSTKQQWDVSMQAREPPCP